MMGQDEGHSYEFLEEQNQSEQPRLTLEEMDTLVQKYKDARDRHAEIKLKSAEIWKEVQQYESEIMEELRLSGKSSYKVDGLGTFTAKTKMQVTTPKTNTDKQHLFDYIRSKYGVDTLTGMLSINHQKLNSFYKEEFENANDPMFKLPGVEEPTSVEIASFRKS